MKQDIDVQGSAFFPFADEPTKIPDKHILVTANHHYHLRGKTCVAVVDPETGEACREHRAIGSHVVGMVTSDRNGSWNIDINAEPKEGKRVLFSSQLLTSPLQHVLEAVQREAEKKNLS